MKTRAKTRKTMKSRRVRHARKMKTTNKKSRTKKRRRARRTKRRMRAGSSDAPLAYDPTNKTEHVLNPHLGYTGQQKMQLGGNHANVVTPFVGKPWGAEIEKLPGVGGPHDGNHYSQNPYNQQPEMHPVQERTSGGPVLSGGRRRTRKRGRGKKGGMFQVFSQLKSDLTNGYREMTGRAPEPSPLPYKDQVFNGERAENNLGYLKVNNKYLN